MMRDLVELMTNFSKLLRKMLLYFMLFLVVQHITVFVMVHFSFFCEFGMEFIIGLE